MKKHTLFLLLFSIVTTLFSQNFQILSLKTKKPISYSSIEYSNGSGKFSDENGFFVINDNKEIDFVIVSSLGFYPKKITISELKKSKFIFLEENISRLDEIVINQMISKTLKHYRPPHIINTNFYKSAHRLLAYDALGVTFIPYPKDIDTNMTVKIKNIVVSTTYYGSGEKARSRKYWPFKVNLYKSNQKNTAPRLKDSLLTGIISHREEGSSNPVKIPVDNYNLELTKDGVFVSFEVLPKSFYKEQVKDHVPRKLAKKGFVATSLGPVVRTIKLGSKKHDSHSYTLDKRDVFQDDSGESREYWEKEREFIYDITLEIEYSNSSM